MVDEGLTRGMVEWVSGHVLRYHLGIDAHLNGQDGVWRNGVIPPLASRPLRRRARPRRASAARWRAALAGLGFDVHGWSRRPRPLPGVTGHSRRRRPRGRCSAAPRSS